MSAANEYDSDFIDPHIRDLLTTVAKRKLKLPWYIRAGLWILKLWANKRKDNR